MRRVMFKLELLSVKYIPVIIAVIVLLNTVLSYLDIYLVWLDYVAGTSLLTLIPMYISSCVYRFCVYHRMFIHYIFAHKIVAVVDMYIGIPVSDMTLLCIYLTMVGVFIMAALVIHLRYDGTHKKVPSQNH